MNCVGNNCCRLRSLEEERVLRDGLVTEYCIEEVGIDVGFEGYMYVRDLYLWE